MNHIEFEVGSKEQVVSYEKETEINIKELADAKSITEVA